MGFRLLYSMRRACHHWQPCIPFFQAVRQWAEAIGHIRSLRVNAGGFRLLLGDATGALGLVEKTGLGTVVLPEQKNGAFAHANGILDPAFAKRNPPQGDSLRTNSQQRYENVLRQLDTGAGMEQILCDRSPRGAICQRGENGMHTDFAAVFAPVEKKFKFWSGTAGSETGQTVDVTKIFIDGTGSPRTR